MIVKSSTFKTSVVNSDGILNLEMPEFAFVGRSNVGKSSLINAIAGKNKLAKTSSTPGYTKFVNYFIFNEKENPFSLVDLPGYGFSKTGKQNMLLWSDLITAYFERSQNLKCVFVLVDSRIEPTEKDLQMIKYLYAKNIPFKVVASKTDKLSKAQLSKNLKIIASALKITTNNIICVSAEKKENINLILETIEKFMD